MATFQESVEAKVQSQVATFLSLKEQLLNAANHINPEISTKAKELYRNQLRLENQLKEQLVVIAKLKMGVYTYTEIGLLGLFANAMNVHIKDSQKVIDASKGLPTTDSYMRLAKMVFSIGAIGLIVIYLFKGTRK